MKRIVLAMMLCMGVVFAHAQLIKNDFLVGYNVGDALEKALYNVNPPPTPLLNQWNAPTFDTTLVSSGTASPKIVAPLNYTGYAESGQNFAIQMAKLASGTRVSGYSLASTSAYNSGSYYLAFMVNFSQVTTTSFTDFFALDQNYFSNTRRSVLWVIRGGATQNDNTKFRIVLTTATTAPTVASNYASAPEYNTGETYLFVLKYEFGGNISLYVNPIIADGEPASPTLSVTATGGLSANGIRAIDIRQRTTLEAQIGGFRFAQSWADAVPAASQTATATLTLQQPTIGGSLTTPDTTRVFNIGDTVTITAHSTGNYIFKNFVVNGVTTPATSDSTLVLAMDTNKTVSAVFEAPTTATLTLDSPTGGSLTSVPSVTTVFNIGDEVIITATPDATYALKNFVVNGIDTTTASGNTLTLTMDGNKTVSAVFGLKRTLTLTQPTEGGSLAATPDTTVFIDGSTVTITATPTGTYVLKSFVVNGDTIAASGNTLALTMDADKTVSVVFGSTATLTLAQSSGGSIAASPAKDAYDATESVTITATPDANYILKNFVVNGTETSATSENTLVLTMDGDKTVSAVFERSATLALTQPSTGGSLSIDPDKAIFGVSESVTVTATPATGFILKNFVVNGTETSATSENTLVLAMDTNKMVTAVFERSSTLTLMQPSTGGSLTIDPDKAIFGISESVTITAVPAANYTLTNFVVNGVVTPATSGNTLVLAMDSNKTVTAVFEKPAITLTLQQPTGGSLTASPDKTGFDIGESVTITASQAANYRFKNFIVNGVNTPATSGNTLVLTMDSNKIVSAVFQGPILKNDFLTGFSIGSDLEKGYYNPASSASPIQQNQWNGTAADATAGTASPKIVAPLIYSGYAESGKDFAAQMALLSSGTRTSGYSLTNVDDYNIGSYYVAFMVNFSQITAGTSFADFFALDRNYFSNTRRDVLWVIKGSDNTKFKIALTASTTAPAVADYANAPEYNIGQTYLFVVKQDFDNQAASLYINPVPATAEPAANLSVSAAGGIASIRAIDIRQRATIEARIGGFRFANSWADAVAPGPQEPQPTVANLTLQQPSDRSGTLAASPNQTVFNAGDQVTITATPATNYTLKNFVVNGTAISATSGNTLVLTMDGDKTVTAVFEVPAPEPVVPVVKRDFLEGYNVGESLEKGFYSTVSPAPASASALLDQWNGTAADAAAGTVSPLIIAPLTYTGYAESGTDYAIQLAKLASGSRTSGYSLANTNVYNAGSFYVAFMVNFSQVGTSLTEFFALDQTFYSNSRRSNVYVMRGSSTSTFKVAIAPNTTVPNAADYANAPEYNIGQTYLFVVKQDFDNSQMSLYINPAITAAEPTTADLSISVAGSGLTNIRAIDIRQRTTIEAQIGGFRFANSWSDAVAPSSAIAVSGISFDNTSLSMNVNDIQQLTVSVLPADATNQNVTWSSSNPAVATVSNTGLITAIGPGTATITATTVEGGFTASCTVNVLQQGVVAQDSTQVGAKGNGTIVLSLTVPANVLFSGSFQLTLPNGIHLNLDSTYLVDSLASQLTLDIVQKSDSSWLFTITPSSLRSAKEMAYSQIMEIGYIIDKTVAKGTYKAAIRDLAFTFDDGTSITESEVPVRLTVNSQSGIPQLSAETSAYLYSNRLYVKSSVAEAIQVYSLNGVLLYNFRKPAGAADYLISKAPGSILIVKGSSSWVKKVINKQ